MGIIIITHLDIDQERVGNGVFGKEVEQEVKGKRVVVGKPIIQPREHLGMVVI